MVLIRGISYLIVMIVIMVLVLVTCWLRKISVYNHWHSPIMIDPPVIAADNTGSY